MVFQSVPFQEANLTGLNPPRALHLSPLNERGQVVFFNAGAY
jgi:hypothetical protein